ncbi:HesA/MoeB/ThiF family protein [Geobacter sp.]|uniref:HesA/MoeB/ThiF family protein n=1 Tax=Geobacter sp. TaxID=46610 RepID=UPI0026326B7F|nr:HesA/MoeB/ThiF family protein [Geobacter sp.]
MPLFVDFIQEHAEADLVPWECQVEAARRYGLTIAEAEEAILRLELLPARYQRNRAMLTTAQQLRLFRSRVAVVGCGGLGGYVIEELARLGVGTIVAIDPDIFVEHNLNRQLYSSPRLLGASKVEAAAARIEEINPAVTLIPRQEMLTTDTGRELLHGSRVAVDALDSIAARLELAEVCDAMGLPLVHGAIGGWYGQVFTQLPGQKTLQRLYADLRDGRGVEKQLGNPSFTPAVVASMEVAEVCKVLLALGTRLSSRKLTINLLDMETEEIAL